MRYDALLAVIPLSLLTAVAVGQFTAVPSQTALRTAALLCAVAIADGLFRNPPRTRLRQGSSG